jgi:hypothetical protein
VVEDSLRRYAVIKYDRSVLTGADGGCHVTNCVGVCVVHVIRTLAGEQQGQRDGLDVHGSVLVAVGAVAAAGARRGSCQLV